MQQKQQENEIINDINENSNELTENKSNEINELEQKPKQFEETNEYIDGDLDTIFVTVGQTKLFNTFNEFEKKEDFKKTLIENSQKISGSLGDVLNNWYKKNTDDQINKFKTILENKINDDPAKKVADDALNKIIEAQEFIDFKFKEQKIKSKKRINSLIFASCFFIVGFFFLKKRKENKKIINEFKELRLEKENFIKKQWQLKSDMIYDIFNSFSKTKIINEVFKDSGIYIQDYASVPNLYNTLRTIITNSIGFFDTFAINIGKKAVYFTNYCKEWLEEVVTQGTTSVTYTTYESYTDSDGNYHTRTVVRTQTVVAYHYEITPRRELDALSIMKIRDSNPEENNFSWTLKFKKTEKNQKIDHLKREKIAKNKKQKIDNILNLENQGFNYSFDLNADHMSGSIIDEQIINTWFTIGTQENLLNFKNYCDELNINLIYYFIIRKTLDFLIVYHEKPINVNWLTNCSFANNVKYTKTISVQDNINLLAQDFKNFNDLIMSHSLIYLSINKTLNNIVNEYSFKNYSLTDINNEIEPFTEIDGSYLISLGVRNDVLFSTNPNKVLLDNYIEESTNLFENFTETIVQISNYFITNEVDYVNTYASYANKYVTVPVCYEKYHIFFENAIIISINMKNIENFKDKLNKYTKYLHNLSIEFYAIYDNDRVNLFFNNIQKNSVLHNEIFLFAETQFNKA